MKSIKDGFLTLLIFILLTPFQTNILMTIPYHKLSPFGVNHTYSKITATMPYYPHGSLTTEEEDDRRGPLENDLKFSNKFYHDEHFDTTAYPTIGRKRIADQIAFIRSELASQRAIEVDESSDGIRKRERAIVRLQSIQRENEKASRGVGYPMDSTHSHPRGVYDGRMNPNPNPNPYGGRSRGQSMSHHNKNDHAHPNNFQASGSHSRRPTEYGSETDTATRRDGVRRQTDRPPPQRMRPQRDAMVPIPHRSRAGSRGSQMMTYGMEGPMQRRGHMKDYDEETSDYQGRGSHLVRYGTSGGYGRRHPGRG